MRWLLDTHALIWLILHPDRLGERSARALVDIGNTLHFSIASVWEGEIKRAKGALDLPPDVWDRLENKGISLVPITKQYCRFAADLPPLRRDPFDRMLVAQAITEGLTLVTKDQALSAYGLPVLW